MINPKPRIAHDPKKFVWRNVFLGAIFAACGALVMHYLGKSININTNTNMLLMEKKFGRTLDEEIVQLDDLHRQGQRLIDCDFE